MGPVTIFDKSALQALSIHRDLLVFRRSAHAEQGAVCAVEAVAA